MLKKNSDVHALIMAQIRDVEKCLLVFENFMTAAIAGDTTPELLRALCENVKATEAAADNSLLAMINSLSRAPYLPSTQEELISIGTSCDKIANRCETIAKRIVLQRIACPNMYVNDIKEIFAITKKQFEKLEKCIGMLFSQMNVLAKETEHLAEIRMLESDIDAIEDQINEKIFASDLELAEKMQFAQIVEFLCDVSDIIEDIADQIQIMLITRKA